MPNQCTIEKVRRNPDGTFKQIYPDNIRELLSPRIMLTVATIAEQFGMSDLTAYRRLRSLGLYPKPRRIIPKEELERLYLKEERSLAEVARLFSCDPDLVRNRLHYFDISIRTHTEAMSLAGKQKKTGLRGQKHSNWRGGRNSLPYSPIIRSAHFWLRKHYGRACRCDLNSGHISTVYDFANISGQYKKERGDWLMLCHSCHYWFDHPDIPSEKQSKLKPDHNYAYLQGRKMRACL